MEETGRKCERPTQQGVLTVLDTWSNGLMGMLSTSVTGNLSDWTMVIEWNKPVSENEHHNEDDTIYTQRERKDGDGEAFWSVFGKKAKSRALSDFGLQGSNIGVEIVEVTNTIEFCQQNCLKF